MDMEFQIEWNLQSFFEETVQYYYVFKAFVCTLE